MVGILQQVMRGRMMVDEGLIRSVYLPWIMSYIDGKSTGLGVLKEKGEFAPVAYCMSGNFDFERSAFSGGAYRAADNMAQAQKGSVGVVPVIGEFLKYGTQCSYGASDIVPAIYMAGDNQNIIALVLDIDSGGGAESAVPIFLEAIKYVHQKGKPVVVHCDMLLSAAYYVGANCDYIMADNKISSRVGSVGVYASIIDNREKLKKEGIEVKQIYATQSTLKNHEAREYMDNNNEMPLMSLLISSADRFIESIRENRKGKIKKDSDVYKGKAYEGDEMLTEGLIDGFGSLMDAVKIAGSMALMGRKK